MFSFHGSKTISTGEGGMLATNDAELYEKILTLSNHGRDRNETRMFWPAVVGFKYKMSNIQAAMGCAQLLRINELVRKRQQTLSTYKKDLLPLGSVSMNPDQEGCENGAWMPTVIFEEKSNSSPLIQSEMRQSGIDVRPFFVPLSRTGLFLCQKSSPVSNSLYECGINLPSFFDLNEDEQKKVVEVLGLLVKKCVEK